MSYWRAYWERRRDGGHRAGTEAFLEREAEEKLLVLDGGSSLLDIGCGAAELLVHYAVHYRRVVGCDFSPSMLAEARQRLVRGGLEEVALVEADAMAVWDEVSGDFDRVTAGQVAQYLSDEQLVQLLRAATARLSERGRIVLFDVIDPRLGYLFALGLLGADGRDGSLLAAILRRGVLHRSRILKRRLRGLPAEEIGVAHHPERLREMASALQLSCDITWSRFYEYRYHAVLSPAHRPIASR